MNNASARKETTDTTAAKEKPAEQAIAVVDLGGQYCHMIGRRLRDLGVHAEILHQETNPARLENFAGVILSGGPQSVYADDAPKLDPAILDIKRPILGICYGHQLLAHMTGARVAAGNGEYGKATLRVRDSLPSDLFNETPASQTVWMSHGDSVQALPTGFVSLAETDDCGIAAYANTVRQLYGVQFHPEVAHSEFGTQVLRNFTRSICGVHRHEHIKDRVARLLNEIRTKVGDKSVFFFVSGGVDSTVAFALCARALSRDKVLGVYVDTGLMRQDETAELRSLLAEAGLEDRLRILDESEVFLAALTGVTDPEKKRHIIGKSFIDVQHRAMSDFGIDGEAWLLGQGTIYPDTVESGGSGGTTAVIKTHHNRCAEVRELLEAGKVIEPLAEFYKDEVRQIGSELGLGKRLTARWPFPGPGLAIRVLCSDAPTAAIHPVSLDKAARDYTAVRFPIRSVGVQGDGRTYREVAALQGPLDYERLAKLSSKLCNTGRTFNRTIVLLAGENVVLSEGRAVPAVLDRNRIALLRRADNIVKQALLEQDALDLVWQFPTILIPVTFQGGESIVLRPINSDDGMTATFARLPIPLVDRVADEIASLPGIDAVFLDVTDKPPATIEWE